MMAHALRISSATFRTLLMLVFSKPSPSSSSFSAPFTHCEPTNPRSPASSGTRSNSPICTLRRTSAPKSTEKPCPCPVPYWNWSVLEPYRRVRLSTSQILSKTSGVRRRRVRMVTSLTVVVCSGAKACSSSASRSEARWVWWVLMSFTHSDKRDTSLGSTWVVSPVS